MVYNISEAKTHLSKLIDRAFRGEKVVVAKNGTPLVDIVPHVQEGLRSLGQLSGKVKKTGRI